MLVKKPTRRSNSHHQPQGPRARGHGTSEPGSSPLNTELNRAATHREVAPNLEAPRQDPHPPPTQNLGSRFHALVADDPNVDTENHDCQVDAGDDSPSNLDTNSSLVRIEQGQSLEAGASHIGNRNPEDKESLPRRRPQVIRDVGPIITAQDHHQPNSDPLGTWVVALTSQQPITTIARSRPMRSEGFDSSRSARTDHSSQPDPLGLDESPGDNDNLAVGIRDGSSHNGIQRDMVIEEHRPTAPYSPIHGQMDLDC